MSHLHFILGSLLCSHQERLAAQNIRLSLAKTNSNDNKLPSHHRENGATIGMVPLINPIYALQKWVFIGLFTVYLHISPMIPGWQIQPSVPPFRLVDYGQVHHQLLIAGGTRSWQLPPRPWDLKAKWMG